MNERPEDDETIADGEQADVARLLAAAAPPVAVPDDVAAHLDDVLAGLVRERSLPDGVVPMPAARRRRWPNLLVAAAAVSVLGLGLGELVDDDPGQTAATQATEDSSADSALPAESTRPQTSPSASAEGLVAGDGKRELAGKKAVAEASDRVPRVRRDSLAVDLQRIETFSLAVPADRDTRTASACAAPPVVPGEELLRVRLDGEPALLVLGAPEGGRRTAEIFRCDDGDAPVVSTTIDAH